MDSISSYAKQGRLQYLFVAAGGLRLMLIAVAAIQDHFAEVPYSDIDYQVFSEASKSVALGLGPYNERTPLLQNPETKYRYTPLLAYALLPNSWLFPAWGKVLFSALDLLAAHHLARWLRAHRCSPEVVWWGVASWLFNPFAFTISTRGSCESIIVFLLYWTLNRLYLCSSPILAGVLFGLSVHWRIYPIIYTLPVLLSLGQGRIGLKRLINMLSLRFGLAAAGTFLALAIIFYAIYGEEFMNACYLYHASRLDTKHNFSVYFLPNQLHLSDPHWYPNLARFAIVPQFLLCALLGWKESACPVRAMLLQTLGFVALNKVITAQYFVWWLSLIPPALPWLRVDLRLAQALGLWVAAEVHWLCWAYFLEFRRWHVTFHVWTASCLFLVAEAYLGFVLSRNPVEDAREKIK